MVRRTVTAADTAGYNDFVENHAESCAEGRSENGGVSPTRRFGPSNYWSVLHRVGASERVLALSDAKRHWNRGGGAASKEPIKGGAKSSAAEATGVRGSPEALVSRFSSGAEFSFSVASER